MPFRIIRNDITRVKADAIVNTANPRPEVGAGVDSAIHHAAGPELLAARVKIGAIAPGAAAVTPAFGLRAKFVIHTVGPVWRGGGAGEAETLASCYRASLALAEANKCRSVAFPLISTGTYGFPRDLALQVAVREIGAFVLAHEMDVTLVVFDPASFVLSRKLDEDIASYVDENYVRRRTPPQDEANRRRIYERRLRMEACYEAPPPVAVHEESIQEPRRFAAQSKLDVLLAKVDEPFTKVLFRLIAAKKMTDVEVYKRANLDRKLFSKIRSDRAYHPTKKNCLALAVALRLDVAETRDLIGRAGYLLSNADKRDIVVQYFIERGDYDINRLNAALFSRGLKCVGG